MSKLALTASSVTVLTLALGLPSASAQPNTGEQSFLEEVIVTAQRRAQSLQDAAIPVQTFGQD
ncbi:MAG: hypothetical protein AB8C02_18285, partial [Halioglobus sp.]